MNHEFCDWIHREIAREAEQDERAAIIELHEIGHGKGWVNDKQEAQALGERTKPILAESRRDRNV